MQKGNSSAVNKKATELLKSFNTTYLNLHKKYEDLYWISYMGDHSVDKQKDTNLAARDTFKADIRNVKQIEELLSTKKVSAKIKIRLGYWLKFFKCYQTPTEVLLIKEKINTLETVINKKRSEREEGYIDPTTKTFVSASENKMRSMMVTNPDEAIRKACFDASEKLALDCIAEYIELIGLRNSYAQKLGYADFYEYKVQHEDGMTKKELFSIFNTIYEKTKYVAKDIKKLEKKTPGITKPWNFGYMISGDFTKEEEPYFQFEDALLRWGTSFAALGIDFKKGKLQLDLLDRKGKWNNGFCHWPDLVSYNGIKRIPGSSNFTCNVVLGQIGSGKQGYATLFHEGGHAAHLLNITQEDVCMNHEYAPMSTSWAETHSMFIDTIFSSIVWKSRYAKNTHGEVYPFELYERKVRKLNFLQPIELNGIIFVSNFEKEIYEENNLTKEKVFAIARKNYRKYFERSEDSIRALNVPHIYDSNSSASYHGYGLATLSLYQWREYFMKKYGYIVDNPKVGKEMEKVWKLGATKTFNEFVKIATGKKPSAQAFLTDATATVEQVLIKAKKDIKKLSTIKPYTKKINLNANIHMVHGKEEITSNKNGFEKMAEDYKIWLGKINKKV